MKTSIKQDRVHREIVNKVAKEVGQSPKYVEEAVLFYFNDIRKQLEEGVEYLPLSKLGSFKRKYNKKK